MSFFSQAFRSTISLSIRCLESHLLFGFQSHCLFQFDIQSRVFSLAFKAIVQLGIQSHIFSLVFRATSPVWHSEPSSYHDRAFIATFSVFRAVNSIWVFRASSLVFNVISFFQFGVQSHHIFSVTTFRVVLLSQAFRSTISLLVWCLEQRLQFGVQIHHPITIGHSLPPFRRSELHSQRSKLLVQFGHSELRLQYSMLSAFLVRYSEPCLQFSIQSHHVFLQLGVQIHHISFSSMFRAASSFWCSESLFVSV